MEMVALRSLTALLFLVAVLVVVPSIQATVITPCNKKAKYAVKVDDVVISPYPIKTGEPTTFAIQAYTAKPISGGKLPLEVSYLGAKVHSESDDICGKTSCPIQAGKFVISHTQALPKLTPPGTYTLRMRILDEKKTVLTCFSFKFKISLFESVASI